MFIHTILWGRGFVRVSYMNGRWVLAWSWLVFVGVVSERRGYD